MVGRNTGITNTAAEGFFAYSTRRPVLNLADLKAYFNPTLISWRVGATNQAKDKGIALAYLNARDVMERLDEVCGPTRWQAEYPFQGCCKIGIMCERSEERRVGKECR